jgi:hypothetical protein
MSIKVICRTVGVALLCAIVVGFFDKQFGFSLFFGVSAALGAAEFFEQRRRKRLAALLSKSEGQLAKTVLALEESVAQARTLNDTELADKASATLQSTQELLAEVRATRAGLA